MSKVFSLLWLRGFVSLDWNRLFIVIRRSRNHDSSLLRQGAFLGDLADVFQYLLAQGAFNVLFHCNIH